MGKYRAYESYKDSGVEWLGDIPEHWKLHKVKRTVSIFGRIGFRGYTTADIVSEGEGVITLSPSNIVDGKINYLNRTYLSWEKYYESPEIQVFSKDILFVKTGSTIGKVAIVENMPEPMTINPQLVVLKKINCYPEFLAYVMNADFYQFQVMGFRFGGSTPAMTQESLGQTQVILPPLEEQKAIARFLDYKTDRIDALIAKKEALLEKLDEKRTALISHAVTKGLDATVPMKDSGIEWLGKIPEHWEVKKLRYVGSCQNGVSKGGDYFGSGYPFVNYTDVYANLELPKVVNGLAQSTDADRINYSVEKGDIFFTRTSETIEEIGITSTCLSSIENAIFSGFLIRFRPFVEIIFEEFSKYYFRCQQHRLFFVKEMNLVTRASLSQDLLKRLPVLLPPFKEQKEIAEHLDKKTAEIDNQKAKVREAIELLKEYRTSLITNAVTGKIDVRQVPLPNKSLSQTT